MDVLHARAQLHLLGLATRSGAGPPPPLQRGESRDATDAGRRRRLAAAGEALVALGALGEDEVVALARRLEAEIALGPTEALAPVSEALARRSRRLLEERLVEVAAHSAEVAARGGAVASRSESSYQAALDRFGALHQACQLCGALSRQELARWQERLSDVDDGRSWHLERARRQRRLSARELLAVVPGAASRDRRLQITTAELYADGVILRWHERAADGDDRPAWRPGSREASERRRVALHDDVGTDYLHFHTNETYGVGGGVLWTARFATAVPAAATQLVAQIRDERLSLAPVGTRGRS